MKYGDVEHVCDPGDPELCYKRIDDYHQVSSLQKSLYEHVMMVEITNEVENELAAINQREQNVAFKLSIALSFPVVDFYFYVEDGKTYLFSMMSNDCSA